MAQKRRLYVVRDHLHDVFRIIRSTSPAAAKTFACRCVKAELASAEDIVLYRGVAIEDDESPIPDEIDEQQPAMVRSNRDDPEPPPIPGFLRKQAE